VESDCELHVVRVVERARITGDAKEIERQPGRETVEFNIDFSSIAAAEQVKTGTRS
jgi:hypothetical protein